MNAISSCVRQMPCAKTQWDPTSVLVNQDLGEMEKRALVNITWLCLTFY